MFNLPEKYTEIDGFRIPSERLKNINVSKQE